jgi:hypothetical protein
LIGNDGDRGVMPGPDDAETHVLGHSCLSRQRRIGWQNPITFRARNQQRNAKNAPA